MPNINFFKYNLEIEALYDTEIDRMLNTMLYQTTFEIFKGTDNQIFITVKDHNRKAVNLAGKHIVAYLINDLEDKTYFVGNLEINDCAKGKYQITFRKNVIESFPTGHYRMILVTKNCEQDVESLDNIEQILYTGEDFRPIMEVKICDGVFESFRKSTTITNFNFRNDLQWYFSDPVDMSKLPDRDSNIVTIAITTERFVGDVIVEGCYDENPSPVDVDWIPLVHKQYSIDIELPRILEPDEMNRICYGYDWKDVESKPQCFGITFESNCRWLRIKYHTYISEEFPCEMKSTIVKAVFRS